MNANQVVDLFIVGGILSSGTATAVMGQAAISGDGTPTTIIGAFIGVTMTMAGGYGFVVKRLFDDQKASRETFAASLDRIALAFTTAVDKIMVDQKDYRADSAERHSQLLKSLQVMATANVRRRTKIDDDEEDSPPRGIKS